MAKNDQHKERLKVDRFLEFVRDLKKRRKKKYYWNIGDDKVLAKDMRVSHLRNAIAYSLRHNMFDPILVDMIQELESREDDPK
jgi:hypothetical protein